jgi:hypothetical protein
VYVVQTGTQDPPIRGKLRVTWYQVAFLPEQQLPPALSHLPK